MTRKKMNEEISDMIISLKSMADEYEHLLNEMDNLTDEEFDNRSLIIQDKYSEKGIELF